jgi:hypothetical protein
MNESATTGSRQRVPIFTRSDWQMPLGDRAVLEGVLTQIKPSLSVEIGTAQGGSLERIAAHSDEVHALDLSDELLVECPPNAEFHKGDSERILPELLAGSRPRDTTSTSHWLTATIHPRGSRPTSTRCWRRPRWDER